VSTTEIKYNETFPASSDFVLTLFSSHEMEETLITAGTSRHPHHCTSCNHLVILCLFSTSRKSSSIKKHLERLVLRIFLQPRDRKLFNRRWHTPCIHSGRILSLSPPWGAWGPCRRKWWRSCDLVFVCSGGSRGAHNLAAKGLKKIVST
jgi:hypothetical protein